MCDLTIGRPHGENVHAFTWYVYMTYVESASRLKERVYEKKSA
jgi:hypothetical protein